MRHSYLKRKEGEDAFTDLLFNALLGFAFMFVTAFSLISEPSEGGKITPNAEILITIRWPDDHPDDVDTIVEDQEGLCFGITTKTRKSCTWIVMIEDLSKMRWWWQVKKSSIRLIRKQ